MIKSAQYWRLGGRDADSGVGNAALQGGREEDDGIKESRRKRASRSKLKVSKLLKVADVRGLI